MTGRTLAIDTTHEFGSIALLERSAVLDEVLVHAPEGFGRMLFERIGALLERWQLELADIECFAAASGPGSFTGIRVGLASMKGLAEASGRPAYGISTLRAIASFGSGPMRAAVLDARRGEVYAALYDSEGRLLSPEVVTRFGNWLEALPGGDVEFVCAEPFRTALAGTRFANSQITAPPRALAAAVGRLASTDWLSGRPGDPAFLDANYVRRSDAELFWKDSL